MKLNKTQTKKAIEYLTNDNFHTAALLLQCMSYAGHIFDNGSLDIVVEQLLKIHERHLKNKYLGHNDCIFRNLLTGGFMRYTELAVAKQHGVELDENTEVGRFLTQSLESVNFFK